MGASSSRRLGCCIKISLDTRHSCRISASESCTCFPGLLPLTSRSRCMIPSNTAGSIPPSRSPQMIKTPPKSELTKNESPPFSSLPPPKSSTIQRGKGTREPDLFPSPR
ncbi:hypothetical protein COCNU_scaffold084446G000010 [Cocos nucifera]|nr:hypothetical protein [Cocos nucifera]